jgi:hypothetical protein
VVSGGLTIAQVVGHIAEWERFTILAAGEIMAGVQWPRIMTLSGYVEPDGRGQDFSADPGECVGLPGERVARPPHNLNGL